MKDGDDDGDGDWRLESGIEKEGAINLPWGWFAECSSSSTRSPVIIEDLSEDARMPIEEVFIEDGVVISQCFSKAR